MDKLAIRWAANARLAWAILGVIVLAAAALLLLAPAEATIGDGIRFVYIHVALIWAGMLLLIVAGLLGMIVLLGGRPGPAGWMQIVAWVALGFFAAGVITSLAAEIVNWGGIAWREPRTAANLNLLAVVVIVQVVSSWLPKSWAATLRLQGALNLLLAVAVVWTTITTELQLHPANAVGDATSRAIQLTFYGLFLLCLLAAVWLILYARSRAARYRAARYRQLTRRSQSSELRGNAGKDKSGRSSKDGI